MAATIKIKNSSTTGSVPTSGNLVQGELAVNVTDLGLYTENASGTVVKLNAPSIDDKNTGATKYLTIDTSGNLLVGCTATPSASVKGGAFIVDSTASHLYLASNTTSSDRLIWFYNPNGLVGGIVTSASATAYNTSSDYRLKENIQPMTGALSTVSQLKPVTYNWKVDGSAGQGFIAHELQAVVPECVTGEKDAVDANGNPVYQGIDTSFLVATLTAAIQELNAKFEAYKAAHP